MNDENPLKGQISVPVIFNIGGKDYLDRMGVPGGGGTSITKTPLKGLKIVPKVLKHFPVNTSLVSLVLIMINNKLYPHI